MIDLPDVSDPDAFEKGFPHELFKELRREEPVFWHEGDYEGACGFLSALQPHRRCPTHIPVKFTAVPA